MSIDRSDPTQRFSERVADYVRHRPGYPQAILDMLRQTIGFDPATVIADIGSGTGNLAELFLRVGNRVYAVEPNADMREAGERRLASYQGFASVAGTAEATTLPADSIDLVTAGQSFHWFDKQAARQEFSRILRPDGWVMLVWNDWKRADGPLNEAYADLVQRYSVDYGGVRGKYQAWPEIVARFYGGAFDEYHFDNEQVLDFLGLRGRLFSSSTAPRPEHPNYAPLMAELREVFDRLAQEGEVRLRYDCRLYLGQLSRSADAA
ncbi:MAG: class I SAM-dependent methyltransferase [Candidatus Promineifilaceae bacterium]|nr:class I SAM-dependent methyltransferase [Candidatus Promineifilaceae bacterium]